MAARCRGSTIRATARARIQRRRVGGLIPSLDRAGLDTAIAILAARDPDLRTILELRGAPPLWDREPGFPTLLHIVLEQQVSLASAKAAFDRLDAVAGPLTPERFLAIDDAGLLAIGFSRQKARYGRALATAIVTGALDLESLALLPDDEVHARLQSIPGIGSWTSTIYLLMVLGRPDVWPAGDIALAQAVADVQGLDRRPGPAEMSALGEAWRPYRSVAARVLWHDYLSRRGRSA